MFTKKEIVHLAISVVVLAFVFGFDDGQSIFVFSYLITNLFRILLLVAVSILLRELFIKLTANKFNSKAEYHIWLIERFWFRMKDAIKPGIPFGIIFSLIGAFVSKGKFFFTAIGVHDIKQNLAARAGNKKLLLGDLQESLIVLTGIYVSIILIYLGFIFDIEWLAAINFFLALYNLIPFSNLDGAKVFFGSFLLWIFSVLLVVFSYLLIPVNLVLALILGIIFSFGVVIYYYVKYMN